MGWDRASWAYFSVSLDLNSVLPLRFCEKVGFFSADGESNRRRRNFSRGVQGHAPPENFENCNANRAI